MRFKRAGKYWYSNNMHLFTAVRVSGGVCVSVLLSVRDDFYITVAINLLCQSCVILTSGWRLLLKVSQVASCPQNTLQEKHWRHCASLLIAGWIIGCLNALVDSRPIFGVGSAEVLKSPWQQFACPKCDFSFLFSCFDIAQWAVIKQPMTNRYPCTFRQFFTFRASCKHQSCWFSWRAVLSLCLQLTDGYSLVNWWS